MLPQAVWMPKQGELVGISPERYTVPSSVRLLDLLDLRCVWSLCFRHIYTTGFIEFLS